MVGWMKDGELSVVKIVFVENGSTWEVAIGENGNCRG